VSINVIPHDDRSWYLRPFYNGAFSIASKHDFDDQFFFARDSTWNLKLINICSLLLNININGTNSCQNCTLACRIVDYIIKSRSESFCAKPRDWRPRRSRGCQLGEAQKHLLLWLIYVPILFYLQADHKKKIRHELIYFLLLQWQFPDLQFSNFKAPVIPSSLVAILLVLEGSIISLESIKV
jgi:hypothetical protein